MHRKPIVHFFLVGAALFALHRMVAPRPPGRTIVVSRAFVDAMGATSDEERRGLVERFVDEEVLYREALALGLDRGDLIVRRRLVQKMEFLARAGAPETEPTDAELAARLAAHRDRYREPPRLSLRHVFLDRSHAGDAPRLLDDLSRGADDERLGDPFLRGRAFARRTVADLAAIFGDAFAAHVDGAATGRWSGPIPSSYGVHLVRVDEHTDGGAPRLDDVRARVRDDLLAERHREAERAAVKKLRERYTVEVER